MQQPEYAYSRNDTDGPWHDDIDSVIDNLLTDQTFDYKAGEDITIYRGVKTTYTHEDFSAFAGETIQEYSQEAAYHVGSEHSEGYLDDMTPEHRDELGRMIVDFLNKNCAQPSFWTVHDIEPIAVRLPDAPEG